MKSFAELFKKYRLKAEFETVAAFSNALSEKGYHYEDSIFSHWQKGTRVPTNRHLVIKIIEIFVERHAIQTADEANELLSSTKLGYLTEEESKALDIKIQKASTSSIRRYILIGAIIFAVLALFTLTYMYLNSLSQKNYVPSPTTVPSAVTEPKKLVIGVDATLKPMEYIEDGKLVGFDIDLGNALAKELHADIEFRQVIFNNIFNSLEQRQINMIISAVTISKERQERYDFSEPYLHAGQVIITKKDDVTIKKISDLKGKRIATQTGTTNEQEAIKQTPDELVMRYADFDQATAALKTGKVNAIFTDLPNAKGIVSNNPELKIVGSPFIKENYGIVFIKGDPSVTQVNDALKALSTNGVLATLEKKWLN